MANFKDSFYNKYVTTHITGRKGIPTLEEFKERARIYQEHFGRFMPDVTSAQILDIGCGNGSIVWWLQQAGFKNVLGIDISIEQIEIGRSLGVINLERADLKAFLHTNKNKYDVIIARDVIEHFNKQDIVEILTLCHDSLNNNGKLILQVPNAESPFFGRIRYGDFTHEIAFSASSIHQVMNMVGFNEVSCFPFESTVKGFKSYLRVALWKIVGLIYTLAITLEVGNSKIERIVTQNIISVATKRK